MCYIMPKTSVSSIIGSFLPLPNAQHRDSEPHGGARD